MGLKTSVDILLLAARCVPCGLVQGLILLNAFTHDHDDEVEHILSKFVDDAKFLGVGDRAAVEESHQSCYISICTIALRCGLLTAG